jgi:hypothetical protein
MHSGHHVSLSYGDTQKGGAGSDGSSNMAILRSAFFTLSPPIHKALSFSSLGHGGDDGSLIACNLVTSWRYYVQSNPVHRPPQPRSVRRRQAVTTPAPAWPILEVIRKDKGKTKEGRASPLLLSFSPLQASSRFPHRLPESSPSSSSPPTCRSRSESSPWAPSFAPSGSILRPTSVVRRKSKCGLG